MDGRGHAVLDNYCFGHFLPQESNYNITSGLRQTFPFKTAITSSTPSTTTTGYVNIRSIGSILISIRYVSFNPGTVGMPLLIAAPRQLRLISPTSH